MLKNCCLFSMFIPIFSIAYSVMVEAGSGPPRTGRMKQFTVINEAPPAPVIPLKDNQGRKIFLSKFKGKVVLLNFWATWCAPCVSELPSLNRLQAIFDINKFVVILVNEDLNGLKVAAAFLNGLGLTNLSSYIDNNMALMRAFEVRGMPTSFVINQDGRIVGKFEGTAEWDSAEVLNLINYYVKTKLSVLSRGNTSSKPSSKYTKCY